MNDEENNIALAEEQEVSRCIEDMYKVFVIGNESIPALLQSLESVLLPLFGLYCFSRHGVSHLRSSCQELVCWYILKAEKSRVMVVLKQLCGLPGPLPILRPRCLFLAGEEGGVRSVIQSTDEEEDEDEVLYCKLQEHQWKLDCLCNLLESLCDSALPGKFFLTCLKDLTDWVVAEVSEDDATSSEKKDSTTALGAVDDSREKQVLLLQLVSILCERLGHQALKDTAQIVEFVGLTLERGMLSGEALNTESLKLAMGLLAALLSGEIELKSEDHASLKTLFPQLNELASMHSAPDIRELASDLCIALATHGVYTADSVTASAQCPLGRRAKVTPENRGSGHCTNQHNNKMENLTKSTEAAARNLRQRRGNVGKGSEQMSSGRGTSLQEVMEAAFDPGVPERAEALRTLTSLLKQRNLEALGLQEKILSVSSAGTSASFLISH
uniref:TANGO6 HEAT repeat domain-containing protein n=1 Tax=Eptatretus burgeri TaxID=7764 RepID=A0A8C4QS75_EPTBU